MLTASTATDLNLTVKEEVLVRASLEDTFDSVLAHMGRLNETPDGKPLPMVHWLLSVHSFRSVPLHPSQKFPIRASIPDVY